jgi:hypothetical protein
MHLRLAAALPKCGEPYEGRLHIHGVDWKFRVLARPYSLRRGLYTYSREGRKLLSFPVLSSKGSMITLDAVDDHCYLRGDGDSGNRLQLPETGLRLFDRDMLRLLKLIAREPVTVLTLTIDYVDLNPWQRFWRKKGVSRSLPGGRVRHRPGDSDRPWPRDGEVGEPYQRMGDPRDSLPRVGRTGGDDGAAELIAVSPLLQSTPAPTKDDAPPHRTGGRVGGDESDQGRAFHTGGAIQGSRFRTVGSDLDPDFTPVGDGVTKFGGRDGGVKESAPAPAPTEERTFGGGSAPAADTGSSGSSPGGSSDGGGGGGGGSGE